MSVNVCVCVCVWVRERDEWGAILTYVSEQINIGKVYVHVNLLKQMNGVKKMFAGTTFNICVMVVRGHEGELTLAQWLMKSQTTQM